MGGKPPDGAHEGGAVDPSNVAAGRIVGADIAGQHATLDLGANLGEGAEAAPAIRDPSHFLADSALQVSRPPYAAEAGAGRVGIAAVGAGSEFPLDAFEREGVLD